MNDKTALGIETNRNSTNWYLRVGSNENHIIIAGCQVHYAIKCENEPNTSKIDDWQADVANGIKEYKRPGSIYIAE